MKTLLTTLVLSIIFVSGSWAKDGPFPMALAVGTWESKTQGVELQITLVKTINENCVLVQVVARSVGNKKIILASGSAIQDLRNDELNMILTNTKGERVKLILRPEYHYDNGNQRVLELTMIVYELDKSENPKNVPATLVRVLN